MTFWGHRSRDGELTWGRSGAVCAAWLRMDWLSASGKAHELACDVTAGATRNHTEKDWVCLNHAIRSHAQGVRLRVVGCGIADGEEA